MVDSINFVRERRRKLSKQQQLDMNVLRYVGIGSGIGMVVLLLSLGIQLFLNLQVQAIERQQQEQLSIINSQSESEKSYVIFATKLQSLSELFTNRRNKQEAIAYFSTLFDDTVLINGISYRATDTDNELTFGVQTQNIFSLDRVVDILHSQDVQDRFKSITYQELNRGENGEYQAKVIVVLKSET